MSRAVTADHVLFDESISAFRKLDKRNDPILSGKSYSYVLSSIEITEPWVLPHCTLHPLAKVNLPGANSAFICRIDNPEWVGVHNSHLYGIALSTIISFATGRLFKSTRNDYLSQYNTLQNHDLLELAMMYPVLVAGPGAVHYRLSAERNGEYKKSVSELITTLHSIPHKKYVQLMQAIRLLHLSLLNKRDDFGLAYFLIVSAIESIAQHAVKRDHVREKHPSEELWELNAHDNPAVNELLSAYRELRGQNQYLQKRYIKFIHKFAPVESWEKIVPHPHQDMADSMKEFNPDAQYDHLIRKNWCEKYPSDLSQDQICKILADSYTHRSLFVHRGEQPPHKTPNSFERFFQEIRAYDGANLIESLLPNYELLFGIAQRSITAWASSK